MRSLVWPAVMLLGFLVLGCEHGPKGSPAGTVESYYDAANDKDWAAMTAMTAPESIKRLGSAAKMNHYLEASYEGWSDFDVDIVEVRKNTDDASGTVQFACTARVYNVRTRKLDPGKCDNLYSVIKREDGKWYILLPESQKLKPML